MQADTAISHLKKIKILYHLNRPKKRKHNEIDNQLSEDETRPSKKRESNVEREMRRSEAMREESKRTQRVKYAYGTLNYIDTTVLIQNARQVFNRLADKKRGKLQISKQIKRKSV